MITHKVTQIRITVRYPLDSWHPLIINQLIPNSTLALSSLLVVAGIREDGLVTSSALFSRRYLPDCVPSPRVPRRSWCHGQSSSHGDHLHSQFCLAISLACPVAEYNEVWHDDIPCVIFILQDTPCSFVLRETKTVTDLSVLASGRNYYWSRQNKRENALFDPKKTMHTKHVIVSIIYSVCDAGVPKVSSTSEVWLLIWLNSHMHENLP